ncbi:hypothetical protein OUZ56_032116 [Daphnia magna]|uniref:Uncharacterized protein n=1 Tax=Daphnia magna TaxID=35525 RepID=A0ABQ9ZW66_9CRUS|nr:hypothetical protein OUZ56_032116 [Daphnia magna]
MMGLFAPGCDCSTTGANRPLSIPAASSSMTLVTSTGIICRKLACRTHSSEVAEHNRGIFMTPAAGSTCGQCRSTSYCLGDSSSGFLPAPAERQPPCSSSSFLFGQSASRMGTHCPCMERISGLRPR